MSHDTNALDCLFGPYDFLDTAQPPTSSLNTYDGRGGRQGNEDYANAGPSAGRRVGRSGGVYPSQASVQQQQQGQLGMQPYGMVHESSQQGDGGYAGMPPRQGGGRCGPSSSGRGARGDHGQPQMMDMMPLPEVGGLPAIQSQQQGSSQMSAGGAGPPPGVGGVAAVVDSNKRQRIGGIPQQKQPQQQNGGDAELQDKADRCRARNREHARQTRRRKKEFVESLQVSVQQLDHENKIMTARLANLDERAQERDRRTESVAAILALRVQDTEDPDAAARWGELVDSDFELKLPHTPYRSFPPYEATSNGRTVAGIPAVMADVKSLRVCLGGLKRRFAQKDADRDAARKHSKAAVVAATKEQGDDGANHRQNTDGGGANNDDGEETTAEDRKEPPQAAAATARHRSEDPQSCSSSSDNDLACETECVLERSGLAWSTDGSLMAPWTLRVSDSKRQVILQQRGMLRATFRGRSSTARGNFDDRQRDNGDGEQITRKERVSVLELTFDTVTFWQQLQRGLRPDRIFKTVPNTLDQALQPSDEARVITSATRPFVIEYVNGPWTKLCGYDPDECVGKTLRILQGPETSRETVQQITTDATNGHATSAVLTNYNKEGEKFENYLRVFPLVDDDGSTKISHMLGVLQNVIG